VAELLDNPTEFPEELSHLWEWFAELSRARPPGGAITFSEVAAWCRLTGNNPSPAEVGLIRRLDDAFREEMTSKRK
jgi:hypothetical protein